MAAGADSEPEAGAYLDRLIELRVFGRKPFSAVPAYSSDESSADLVVARLNRPPLRWMSLKDGDAWTFHWRTPATGEIADDSTAARYARLVSASAPRRRCRVPRPSANSLDRARGSEVAAYPSWPVGKAIRLSFLLVRIRRVAPGLRRLAFSRAVSHSLSVNRAL